MTASIRPHHTCSRSCLKPTANPVLQPPAPDPRDFRRLPFGVAFHPMKMEPVDRARCGSQPQIREALPTPCPAPASGQVAPLATHRASRNRERRIMTASHVLCLSCIWMELNLRWMMLTIRSISLGEMGLVRLCSRSRFITWVVNSLHAWNGRTTNRGRVEGPGPDGRLGGLF